MTDFHDSIVYIDESGDHGPVSPQYPLLVLVFCLFDKAEYVATTSAEMQSLKFRYIGHDACVFHERDINKQKAPFGFLTDPNVREAFMTDLTKVIEDAPFTLVAAAIRKNHYTGTANVYHEAMKFGLERIAMHYRLKADSPTLHFVCEARGKREDRELRDAFEGFCAGRTQLGRKLPCELIHARKERAHAGMELADLIARPIGRWVLNPEQPNRAWEVLRHKFRRDPKTGRADGWGLIRFPRT